MSNLPLPLTEFSSVGIVASLPSSFSPTEITLFSSSVVDFVLSIKLAMAEALSVTRFSQILFVNVGEISSRIAMYGLVVSLTIVKYFTLWQYFFSSSGTSILASPFQSVATRLAPIT
jgi:hypothetical protein